MGIDCETFQTVWLQHVSLYVKRLVHPHIGVVQYPIMNYATIRYIASLSLSLSLSVYLYMYECVRVWAGRLSAFASHVQNPDLDLMQHSSWPL